MSQEIIQEVTFFVHSVIMGVAITFVYDWLLILRRLIKHDIIGISVEDLIFWFACGIGVFYMLYRENNGILRWFAILGAIIGMWIYKIAISKRFVNLMSTFIYKILRFISHIIQIVLKPIKWLVSKLFKFVDFGKGKCKKIHKYLKNKLTVCIKMLKIVLCKQ